MKTQGWKIHFYKHYRNPVATAPDSEFLIMVIVLY